MQRWSPSAPFLRCPLPLPFQFLPGTFLVPVQITGAFNLQSFQFDLVYEETVVQVVLEPSPTLIPGIFAAEFTPGEGNSLSNITSGFPFFPGLVDDVFGLIQVF